MTHFGCDTCSCDCPGQCAFTGGECFEVTFAGWSQTGDPNFSCQLCDVLNDLSLILERDPLVSLTARASAVRTVPKGEDDEDAQLLVALARNSITGAYTVTNVYIADGGSGYLPGTKITFEYGTGQGAGFSGYQTYIPCDRDPFAWITEIGRSEPRIRAVIACDGGNVEPEGWEYEFSQTTDDQDEPVWVIDSVTVGSSSNYCTDSASVTFVADNGQSPVEGTGIVRTVRGEPVLTAVVGGNEVGASVTLSESEDDDERSIWTVASISEFYVFEGPYPEVGDPVTLTGGVQVSAATATISSVDDFGELKVYYVAVSSPGAYYADTGLIESVEITEGGEHFRGGSIISVETVRGGDIYKAYGDGCFFGEQDVCPPCNPQTDRRLSARLRFSVTEGSSLRATLDLIYDFEFQQNLAFPNNVVLTAVADGIEPNAQSITFDTFTHNSLCDTAGTITVNIVDCDTPPQSPCDEMPEQIEVTVSGLSNAADRYNWGALADPSGRFATAQELGNELCQTDTTATCFLDGPVAFFNGSAAGSIAADGTYVFDLVGKTCNRYVYRGYVPGWFAGDVSDDLIDQLGCAPAFFQDFGQAGNATIFIARVACVVTFNVQRTEVVPSDTLCPPESTCPRSDDFGSYANAVLLVGGVTDGAITSVDVQSPGNCYAWRTFTFSEPEATVEVTSPLASGGTFTLTWEATSETEWRVASIGGSGGTGYIDNDEVTLELGDNSCGFGFQGRVIAKRLEPEPTLVLPSPGSGGEVAYTLEKVDSECFSYWRFDSVTVTDGGDGYRDRSEIDVTLDEGEEQQAAVLVVRVTRSEPTVTATVGNATLSVTLSQTADFMGDAVWQIASVSVVDGGSGIDQGEPIVFALDEGTIIYEPSAYANVDEDGAVTSVTVGYGGWLVDDIGPIASVLIEYGGEYWTTDSSIGCVVVDNGGLYQKATPDGVYVTEPVITAQTPCGSGATFEPVVDVDPDSETFGGIVSVTVTDGGENYFPSSRAWLLTGGMGLRASGAAFFHMTDKSQPIPTAPGFFEGRYRDTEAACPQDFNHNAYEAIGNRVSLLCPSDLLSREYRFFIDFGRYWSEPTDADGNPCGNYCANVDDGAFMEVSVRRFADGEDIKWSIQPIPNE